jgi:hypothetical protein
MRSDPYIAVIRPERGRQFLSHASPWSWSDAVSSWSWPGFDGEPVAVEVYADADEVELLLNGSSVGKRPVTIDQEYRTTFDVPYEPGVIEAIARRKGAEVGRYSLTTAGETVVLDACADRADLRADGSDLSFIALTLVDEEGVVHTTLDRRVTIEIDGPGVLQGLCSANPATDEKFTASACSTFDGRALAVVRPTSAGQIIVTVTADGCAPASVTITAT